MKKIFLSLIVLGVISCGQSEKKVKETLYTDDGRIQINFWTAMNDPAFTTLVDGFNNTQDKYFINAAFKGSYGETLTAGIAAIKAGEQPHILQVFEVGTGTMMSAKGIYRPAHTIISNYNIIPSVASYYSTGGKLQSIPLNSSTPVMLFNKDAFRKAGLDPNNVPTTLEELEKIFPKLKEAGFVPITSEWGSYVYIETLSSIHDVLFATYQNGLEDMNKARISLSESHLKTLSTLKRWADNEWYEYYGRDNAGITPFLNGQVAIIFGSSSVQRSLKVGAEFDYGLSYLPYFSSVTDSPKNGTIGGASLWVLEGFTDDVYQGIGAFMDYIYQDAILLQYHKATGYLTLTVEAYELGKSEGYYEINPSEEIPYLQVSRVAGENSLGWRLNNFLQIRVIFEETMEALFQNTMTPEQAVQSYQDRSNKLLEETALTQ